MNAAAPTAFPPGMPHAFLIRIGAWIALVAIIGAYSWYTWREEEPPIEPVGEEWRTTPPGGPVLFDEATPEQWSRSLAGLGEERLAKRLVYVRLRGEEAARGTLVRYDPGGGTRLAYLPAEGEDPLEVGTALLDAIDRGEVVVYRFGDPDDEDLPGESPGPEHPSWSSFSLDPGLSEGWTVLLAPGTGIDPERLRTGGG